MKKLISKVVTILSIIAVLTPFILVLVYISHKMNERADKLKDIEIKRKLELVEWSDVKFDFTNECEKEFNGIEGLPLLLSTKMIYTEEEMMEQRKDFPDEENSPLSVEYLCDFLAESDALTRSFSNELSSIERRYDPSEYERSL